MPYNQVATKYEDKFLKTLKGEKFDSYVPSYFAKDNPLTIDLMASATEAMVAKSERRMGDDWDMLITPFAEYLFEKYGVDPVDCEFLNCYHYRSMIRRGEYIRDKFLKMYGEYIDFDAYEADHPEEDEEEESNEG